MKILIHKNLKYKFFYSFFNFFLEPHVQESLGDLHIRDIFPGNAMEVIGRFDCLNIEPDKLQENAKKKDFSN